MKLRNNHFGNVLFLGETDPYSSTKRLLESGFLKLPKSEDINVPQELLDQWFREWTELYAKAENEMMRVAPQLYNTLSEQHRYNAIVGTYMPLMKDYSDTSNPYLYVGPWDYVLQKNIEVYKTDQSQKYASAFVTTADALISAARRETIALNSKKFMEILNTKGHLLSQDEKKLLEKFYLYQFTTPTSASENAEVQAILDRIYAEDKIVVKNLNPWNPDTGIPQDASVFVKTDWETEQGMLKRDIMIKDSQYVSPMETAFLKAGESIQQDIKTVAAKANNDKNFLKYAGLGLLALFILRRK